MHVCVCAPKKKLIKISPNLIINNFPNKSPKKTISKIPNHVCPQKNLKYIPYSHCPRPPLLPPARRPNPARPSPRRRSRPCFTTSLQNFRTFRASCVRRFLCGPKPCNSCSNCFYNSSYSLSGKRYPILQRRIWSTEAPYTISSSRLPTNQVPRFFWFSLLATTKELQVFLFPSLLDTV